MMKNVFIIDDDPANNYLNELLIKLVSPETRVTCFTNPVQALSKVLKLAAEADTLLLLDLNMPEMSGWEFIEKLKKKKKMPRTFIITSSIISIDMDIALKHETVEGFIQKPLSQKEISRIVVKQPRG